MEMVKFDSARIEKYELSKEAFGVNSSENCEKLLFMQLAQHLNRGFKSYEQSGWIIRD